MEGGYGVFELKAVRDQGLEVNQASRDEADRLGVLSHTRDQYKKIIIQRGWMKRRRSPHLIAIPVLEADINFVRAQVHERELSAASKKY